MLSDFARSDTCIKAVVMKTVFKRVQTFTVVEFLTLFIFCVGSASPEIRLREPHFTTTSGSLTHKRGDTAVLYCSVQNLGERTVVWRKLPHRGPLTVGPNTWVKDKRIHIDHMPNSDQWNLIIENVQVNDSATYECQVSFRSKKLRQLLVLTIKEESGKDAPRIQISGESYLKSGQKMRLTCNASLIDDSVDQLYWYKNDELLSTHGETRIKVYRSVMLSNKPGGHVSSVLEITDTKPSDGGDYVCKSPENSQMAGVRVEIANDSQNTKREPHDPVESMNMQSSPSKKTNAKNGCQSLYWYCAPWTVIVFPVFYIIREKL